MTIPFGTDAHGRPVDMIGEPILPGRGSVPGVIITEVDAMAKAHKDGVYTLNGGRFRIRAGDVLPEGAVMDEEPVAEGRAVEAAPENKSRKAAPETKAAPKDKD